MAKEVIKNKPLKKVSKLQEPLKGQEPLTKKEEEKKVNKKSDDVYKLDLKKAKDLFFHPNDFLKSIEKKSSEEGFRLFIVFIGFLFNL